MMALLSLAWWGRKLSGVSAQAIAVVALFAVIVVGVSWSIHEVRVAFDEARTQGFEAGKAVAAVSTVVEAAKTADVIREVEAEVSVPVDKAAIAELCKRRASCRERATIK